MNRIARIGVALAALVFSITGLSCGDTTSQPPSQLNLDRPMDITFTCFGGMRVTDGRTTGLPTDPITASAQPVSACDIRTSAEDAVPPGQEDLTGMGGLSINQTPKYYGFILQQGPGTVAVSRFNATPTDVQADVLDADPLTPGKNGISVGEDPVAIATDAAGCKVITANAGSCDLSVLDIGSAVDLQADNTAIDVRRLDVKNAAGEMIRSKPAAMAAEPSIDVYGKTCGDTASGLVYVAYPSCHLVAAIDASTGTIVDGIVFDSAGTPSMLGSGNISCPDECSGGATITPGPRPVTIDLEKDARTAVRRMVIGADNLPSFTLVELSDTTSLPLSVAQIALENTTGNLGITQIVMSPQIGMGGVAGVVNDESAAGGQFQFVYAITTEDTIRVADILNLRKECDTNIDPRFLRDIRSVKDLSCLPVGDPLTPPRRTGVKGPGIELIGDAVPISVDIVKAPEIPGEPRIDAVPGKLVGYFAIVGASNGFTFIVNVDDDGFRDLFEASRPVLVPMPLAIAHQLRDSIPERGDVAITGDAMAPVVRCDLTAPESGANGDILLGGPRAITTPARTAPAGAVAPEKITQLPGIRQVTCPGTTDGPKAVSELSFSAPEDIRDVVFPDLRALTNDELWTLTWEGPISQDKIDTEVDGPQIRESQIFVDENGMRIVDNSKPFCDAGVEPNDIVQMRGCDPALGNADCPISYTCFVHPNSQVQGIGACMLEDEADRLAEACKDFLTSVRRFTVGTTFAGKIQLMERRHVLRTTPLEGCTSTAQCDTLADLAAKTASSSNPVDDTTVDDHTWSCEADSLRPPTATGNRCMLKCDATEDCVSGTVCQGGTAGSGAKAGFCMEGVIPPQACVNAPERYELRVGDAFSVVGQRSGFKHATIIDSNEKCVRDPAASRLLTSRVPLAPPPCQPAGAMEADPLSGKRPDGTFEPNPCSFTVEQSELTPIYNPGTCVLATPPVELKARQAPAIKYRNAGMNLTIVDPTYPGDQTCILDRASTFGNIPLVLTGYQIAFRQTAGFSALLVPIQPSLPVRIRRGPANSIWVMDQGDFLSTQLGVPSTRGKVFRIEGNALAAITVLE